MTKFNLTTADLEAIEMALLCISVGTYNDNLSAQMESALAKVRKFRKENKEKGATLMAARKGDTI